MAKRRRYRTGFGPNSKTGRILRHLLDGHSLTCASACDLFQTYSLSAQIYSIRRLGVVVEMVRERNANGFHGRYSIPAEWRRTPSGWDPRNDDWSLDQSDQSE